MGATRHGPAWLVCLALLALCVASSLAADKTTKEDNKQDTTNDVVDYIKGLVGDVEGLGEKVEDLFDSSKWEALSKQATDNENKVKIAAAGSTTGVPNPFPDFGWEIDPQCLESKESYYYRSWDGSCNWLRKGQAATGAQNQAYARDFTPPHYKPGTLGEPREGPNVRELSNIFFKNRKTSYWDHTPWLLGYVEFLVHDLMFSDAGREKGDVLKIDIPEGDPDFPPKTKLEFWRSQRAPGTGENGIPREQFNKRSNWMDLETIYGTSKEMNALLRQKDKNGALQCELILDDRYLPLNDDRFNFSLPGRPGQHKNLFAAGDLRANQDYLLMVYQTIFAREHNRMCGVLHGQNPDWTQEQLFQTGRIVMGAKMNMVGSAYFKAYFIDVPWPNDPTAIMRSWTGKSALEINPLTMSYPWKMLLNPKTGDPYSLPNEFSVGYRWHDLIPASLQIYDKENNPTTLINLAETAFNATSFKETGIDNVVEAMSVTQIPDFHSGIQDTYRNMKFNFRDPEEGNGFDLAAWAILHERERGLPTFNEYIRLYDGVVPFKPRATFEEFTSNVYFQQQLKRLYKTPDDVDLWVGQELDEEWWPHTHIPRSMLIINFYTLFKAAAADRFGINWGMFWCISNYKPWNCPTTNVLQDLLWKPNPLPFFPNAKLPNSFWWEELDLQNQGTNLLHNMVVQNTNVKCLQQNLFFVANPKSNPVVCYGTDDMPSPDADRSSLVKPFIKTDDLTFLPFALWGSVQPFADYVKKYGDVVKFKLSATGTNVLLSNPADLEKIFESDNFLIRGKMDYSDYTYGRMAGFKDGTALTALSNSHNSELYRWKRFRWIFDTQLVSSSSPDSLSQINVAGKKLVSTFDKHVGKKYDPADDVIRVALEQSCHVTFGADYCNRDAERLAKFVKFNLRWINYFGDFIKYSPPYNNPILVLEGKTAKINEAMDFLGQFIRDRLAELRKDSTGKKDLWLYKWAFTPDEDGSLLNDTDVIAAAFDGYMGLQPAFGFIVTHGMWLLAKNPSVVDKAYAEISQVLGSGSRDITIADFHKMPYLHNVVKEIYRYYPPGGQIYQRAAIQDDTLRDWKVPSGTTFMINAANIHQDPRFWENPKDFNPDRFDKPVANNTWIPFGGGKKSCPGGDLSLRTANAYFAYLIRNFKWTYEGKEDPVYRMLIAARTKDPLFFKLQRRNTKDEL